MPDPATPPQPPPRSARRFRVLPLILLGLLAFIAVRHVDDGPALLTALRRVDLGWLLLAALLQIPTYLGVGATYRLTSGALRAPVPLWPSTKMAVVNLFVNSAIPSAGLSGNFFLVKMMTARGVPGGTATLVVILERVFYFLALAAFSAAVIGLSIVQTGASVEGWRREIVALVVIAAIGVGLAVGVQRMLRHPREAAKRVVGWIERAPAWVRRRIDARALIGDADRVAEAGGLAALRGRLLVWLFLCEAAVFVFDALTLWALFRGVGAPISLQTAALGYTLATVFAQVVVIPGTLEVGLAGVLAGLGVRTGTALVVTLLFHLLSLWAVLPFGWIFYRAAGKDATLPPPAPPLRAPRARLSDSTAGP